MADAAITADRFRTVLREHVLDPWFPRSIDVSSGGFLCDFDRTWACCGPNDKFLEFQARHTLTAADASRMFPSERTLRDAALHGFHYLREVMWDREAGGWFHRLDRAGKPLEGETKHVHGMAYAIHACAAVYRTTGQTPAMDLAREAFDWIEQHAHDGDHGGYFGFLTRAGRVIREPSDCPWPSDSDTLGTTIGLKDLNVHSDLLESLTELYAVWPAPTVAERLNELLEIIRHRFLNPDTGMLDMFLTPDWGRIVHPIRTGYQFQTTYRLLLARSVAGNVSAVVQLARQLTDRARERASDRRGGGFVQSLPLATSRGRSESDPREREKHWWVQVEALKAFVALSQLEGGMTYRSAVAAHWRYLERHAVDAVHKGFYWQALDGLPLRQRWFNARLAPAEYTLKGSIWKDASHDGRALMHCIELLNGAP
jgi:mannobiose 2-epimerase